MVQQPARSETQDLCVARVPLFRGLSRDEQERVASLAHPTKISRNEQVYAAGDDVSQLMVVHQGRVKISRVSADGREQIVRIIEAGDFVGESAFLTGSRPDHFATALEAGSMCVFRHRDIGKLVTSYPSVGLRMLEGVSRRLEETEARLAAVISGDVSSRVADYLMMLPARRGAEGLLVQLPLPKKDVASLLDTTPESLSRQLRRLSDSGIIVEPQPGIILLLDVDTLMELSSPE